MIPDEVIDSVFDATTGQMSIITRDHEGNFDIQKKTMMTPSTVGKETATSLAQSVLK